MENKNITADFHCLNEEENGKKHRCKSQCSTCPELYGEKHQVTYQLTEEELQPKKYVHIRGMFKELLPTDDLNESFVFEWNGEYQLEVSNVDGVLKVTNGVNGWGNNRKDEFKDAEVEILQVIPPLPKKEDIQPVPNNRMRLLAEGEKEWDKVKHDIDASVDYQTAKTYWIAGYVNKALQADQRDGIYGVREQFEKVPVMIKCPECDTIQAAMIERTIPWSTYIHKCENCQYTIMESEWNEVKPFKEINIFSKKQAKYLLSGFEDFVRKHEIEVSDTTGLNQGDAAKFQNNSPVIDWEGLEKAFYNECTEIEETPFASQVIICKSAKSTFD